MPSLESTLLLQSVEQEALLQGVDPNIAKAIFLSENSSLREGKLSTLPKVDTATTSPKGAVGIMQVMPATYRGLVKSGFLPPTNDPTSHQGQIKAGVAAIKERMSAGIKDPIELAISYNASPLALETYRKTGQLPAETQEYVKKFSTALGGNIMPNQPAGSSRESGSTSTRNIPGDLKQGMLDASSRFSSMAGDMMTQLQSIGDTILGNTKKTGEAIREEGAAKAAGSKATSQVEIGQIENRNNILNAFGIDIYATDNEIQKNMQIVNKTMGARTQLQEQIGRLQSTSPLTDPLGWLVGQFQASPLIAQHNALAQQENSAMDNIKALQAAAANQSQLQPANVVEALKSKQVAEARIAKAEADAKVAGLESQAQMQVARNLLEISQLQGADLNQRFALAKVLFERETLTWSQSERDKLTKEEVDKLAPINLMMQSVGLPSFTVSSFKALDRDMQARITSAAQFGRWGRTPGEAISTLHEIMGAGGLAQLAAKDPVRGNFMREMVKEGQNKLMEMERKASLNPVSPEASQLKAAKTEADRLQLGVDTWYREQEALLQKGKSGIPTANMFKLPDSSPFKLNATTVANLSQLKDNATAKFIREFAPQGVKNANFRMDDNTILQNAVAQASLDPTSISKIAQDLYQFYQVGMAQQGMMRGAQSLGVEQPYSYQGWAKVNTWTEQPVQMLNPTHIEQWLTMQVTAGVSRRAPDMKIAPNAMRRGTM